MKKLDDNQKEGIVRNILMAIGENQHREGLIDTPKRVVKMWKELFRGYDKTQLPKVTVFNNGSDGLQYDQMICDEGEFHSHCEHHMVPFIGRYYFAYIPHAKGKIIGLSKVARVVDFFAAKLQVQERLTHEVVEHIWNLLNDSDCPPVAMGLVMEGEHLCKAMRGVKKKGKMRTTVLYGAVKHEPETRQEFLNWVNQNQNI